MSEPKLALKFFKVKCDQLDENGRLKPEAELLPYYGENHKTIDKVGVARDLVSPGTNVYRKVQVKQGDLTSSNIGKDKWHGGSAYGYAKGDEHYVNSDDPAGLMGMPQGRSSSLDDPLYTSYINTNNDFQDTEEQAKTYFELINSELNRNTSKSHPYERVPIIMLASDEDVISIHDMLNNNFDAWRDDSIQYSPQHEIQLKKATPIRQITKDDLNKYRLHFDIGEYSDLLNYMKNYKGPNSINPVYAYKKLKFLEKYPEYKDTDDATIASIIGHPYGFGYDNVSENIFGADKREYNEGIFDPVYVMKHILPWDNPAVLSDKQFKTVIDSCYEDIPEHKKRQKNISNTLVDISRF